MRERRITRPSDSHQLTIPWGVAITISIKKVRLPVRRLAQIKFLLIRVFEKIYHHSRKNNIVSPNAPAYYRRGLFLCSLFRKGDEPIDTTYTIQLTETQYTFLLERATELDIPLEDLVLRAIQNQIKENEPYA